MISFGLLFLVVANQETQVPEREDLRNLCWYIQSALIEKASDFVEARWQAIQEEGGHCQPPNVLDQLMCISKEPWPEDETVAETVAVVYILHLMESFRRIESLKSGVSLAVGSGPGRVNVASKILALVALSALGDENCLLRLRVCRWIYNHSGVQTASKKKLSDRRAFTFLAFSGKNVLARGFRTSWSWLVANSALSRGEGLQDCASEYFKTVGDGPELFAVINESVFYNLQQEWHQYKSAKLVPFQASCENPPNTC